MSSSRTMKSKREVEQVMKERTHLSAAKAALLVDKNSRTIVKLSQLLEVYNRPGASDLDKGGLVAKRIEKYKDRITRRLHKLAKFVDTPEGHRPIERPPIVSKKSVAITQAARNKYTAAAYKRMQSQQNAIYSRLAAIAATNKANLKAAKLAQQGEAAPPKEKTPHNSNPNTSTGMTAESERQYAFGWKRYAEFCELRNIDPMIGPGVDPAAQVMEFAKYLMHQRERSVKAAAASSYVSAVGKKLMEANVIESMRELRTPQMKDLFLANDTRRKFPPGDSPEVLPSQNSINNNAVSSTIKVD